MSFSPRECLRIALNPRSIAVIGASDHPNKIGGRPLAFLKRFGFRGEVYPINPQRPQTQGYQSYPSVAALPTPPEMAVIAVPGDSAVDAVDDCAAAGVRVAVIMTSGFGETGAMGREKEQHMVERARQAGMRLIGPNTQGLANFHSGTVASFSTMFLEAPPADGPIGIVSQSGAMSVVPYGMLRERGLGVRYSMATGNDCDVTACEMASVLAEDPELKLLLLYLEGLPDPWHLAETARIARQHGVMVIALKSGRTAAGQAAARSHTGSLASEDRVVDAFMEQHGIWRARTMGELVDATDLYLKGWQPSGRKLVAISNSGAVCVMAADAATERGMELAVLSEATRTALGNILPGFATTSNPVDITAALLNNGRLFGDILPVIAKDPAADAFLIGIPVAGTGYDVKAFALDSAKFAAQTGKPIAIAAPQALVANEFKAEGLPVFRTEYEGVCALHQFLTHHAIVKAAAHRVTAMQAPAHWRSAARRLERTLNEADSLARLARHGLPVIKHRLCRSADEARDAFSAIGAPVVVKGCSADVPHKSEHGLVRLGLGSADECAQAYADMERTLRGMGATFDGVIVAKQAKGKLELMIGAHRDPAFGSVIVIGQGGKYVEAMPDAQILLPPLRREDIARALTRLRIAPVLAGVRGEPPSDTTVFCDAILAVEHFINDDANVMSLDLNPVLIGTRAEDCVVVDALMVVLGG